MARITVEDCLRQDPQPLPARARRHLPRAHAEPGPRAEDRNQEQARRDRAARDRRRRDRYRDAAQGAGLTTALQQRAARRARCAPAERARFHSQVRRSRPASPVLQARPPAAAADVAALNCGAWALRSLAAELLPCRAAGAAARAAGAGAAQRPRGVVVRGADRQARATSARPTSSWSARPTSSPTRRTSASSAPAASPTSRTRSRSPACAPTGSSTRRPSWPR